jgi:hypothetical protein
MGYTLHMTRAADWTESAARPITADEWAEYVSRERSLASRPEGGVEWMPSPGAEPLFLDWHEGRVDCHGADEATADLLVAHARALGAKVLGDEGEEYPRAVPSAQEEAAERTRRRGLLLRARLEQLRYRLGHLFRPPPRHDPWLKPGARVRELDGTRGTVVRVDPWAMYGSGLVTLRYDDGRELSMVMTAHGLLPED